MNNTIKKYGEEFQKSDGEKIPLIKKKNDIEEELKITE